MATRALVEAAQTVDPVEKWALFRDLCVARTQFGVSDRDLTVLNALLSFYPHEELAQDAPIIVFPSNRKLGERAHGMAESTLRRHLAALVAAGLILRHDSPNGKRYAVRGAGGAFQRIFGFDLSPLLYRGEEIAAAAEAEREAAEHLRRLREAVVLKIRDAGKLVTYAVEEGLVSEATAENLIKRSDDLRKALRRKLDAASLGDLLSFATDLLADVEGFLEVSETEKLSGNDNDTERHQQNSNPDTIDFEPCLEKQRGQGGRLPLTLVLKAAPEIATYASDPIRTPADLVAAAEFIRPMLGISPHAWAEAIHHMGSVTASTVLACILQKGTAIHSPGGYLRALTGKAAEGCFSPGPMVMALLQADGKQAA